MLPLRVASEREPFRLLVLGAHADDIEIGCGGTILRLAAERPEMNVRWVVFSGDERRRREALASARSFLAGLDDPARTEIAVHDFRDGYFPADFTTIKECVAEIQRAYRPSLILTHCRDDLHQDHRTIAEVTYNIFRDHLIWEYEIPKYDGDLGNPNLFVPLAEDVMQRKIAALLEQFPSQSGRNWFTADTFRAIARLRGIGCNAPDGVAEAFYCRKAVV